MHVNTWLNMHNRDLITEFYFWLGGKEGTKTETLAKPG